MKELEEGAELERQESIWMKPKVVLLNAAIIEGDIEEVKKFFLVAREWELKQYNAILKHMLTVDLTEYDPPQHPKAILIGLLLDNVIGRMTYGGDLQFFNKLFAYAIDNKLPIEAARLIEKMQDDPHYGYRDIISNFTYAIENKSFDAAKMLLRSVMQLDSSYMHQIQRENFFSKIFSINDKNLINQLGVSSLDLSKLIDEQLSGVSLENTDIRLLSKLFESAIDNGLPIEAAGLIKKLCLLKEYYKSNDIIDHFRYVIENKNFDVATIVLDSWSSIPKSFDYPLRKEACKIALNFYDKALIQKLELRKSDLKDLIEAKLSDVDIQTDKLFEIYNDLLNPFNEFDTKLLYDDEATKLYNSFCIKLLRVKKYKDFEIFVKSQNKLIISDIFDYLDKEAISYLFLQPELLQFIQSKIWENSDDSMEKILTRFIRIMTTDQVVELYRLYKDDPSYGKMFINIISSRDTEDLEPFYQHLSAREIKKIKEATQKLFLQTLKTAENIPDIEFIKKAEESGLDLNDKFGSEEYLLFKMFPININLDLSYLRSILNLHDKTTRAPIFNLNVKNMNQQKLIDVLLERVQDLGDNFLNILNILRDAGAVEPIKPISEFGKSISKINIEKLDHIDNYPAVKRYLAFIEGTWGPQSLNPWTGAQMDNLINGFKLEVDFSGFKNNVWGNPVSLEQEQEMELQIPVSPINNNGVFEYTIPQVMDLLSNMQDVEDRLDGIHWNFKLVLAASIEIINSINDKAEKELFISGITHCLSGLHMCALSKLINMLYCIEQPLSKMIQEGMIITPIKYEELPLEALEAFMIDVKIEFEELPPQALVTLFYDTHSNYALDPKGWSLYTQMAVGALNKVLFKHLQQENRVDQYDSYHFVNMLQYILSNIIHRLEQKDTSNEQLKEWAILFENSKKESLKIFFNQALNAQTLQEIESLFENILLKPEALRGKFQDQSYDDILLEYYTQITALNGHSFGRAFLKALEYTDVSETMSKFIQEELIQLEMSEFMKDVLIQPKNVVIDEQENQMPKLEPEFVEEQMPKLEPELLGNHNE